MQSWPGRVKSPQVAQCQAAVVDALIQDYLVLPKLAPTECQHVVEKVLRQAFAEG